MFISLTWQEVLQFIHTWSGEWLFIFSHSWGSIYSLVCLSDLANVSRDSRSSPSSYLYPWCVSGTGKAMWSEKTGFRIIPLTSTACSLQSVALHVQKHPSYQSKWSGITADFNLFWDRTWLFLHLLQTPGKVLAPMASREVFCSKWPPEWVANLLRVDPRDSGSQPLLINLLYQQKSKSILSHMLVLCLLWSLFHFHLKFKETFSFQLLLANTSSQNTLFPPYFLLWGFNTPAWLPGGNPCLKCWIGHESSCQGPVYPAFHRWKT